MGQFIRHLPRGMVGEDILILAIGVGQFRGNYLGK